MNDISTATLTAQDPAGQMPKPDPALRQFDRFIGKCGR